MKITYNKNPLYTTIELNDFEKKELWYKIKINEMEDILLEAHFNLTDGKFYDLNKARENLDPDYYLDDDNKKSNLDKRADLLLEHYLLELQSCHIGDCTCFACGCPKCMAEQMLGINTLKGLNKHSAHKIYVAFGQNNENTIDQALDFLKNYNPVKGPGWENFSQEDFNKYISGWAAEAKLAYDWLIDYKNNYL